MRWKQGCLLTLLLGIGIVAAKSNPAAAQFSDPKLQRQLHWGDPTWEERVRRPLTLEDCVQIALQRNLPLASARLERQARQDGVARAWGDWWPSLAVTASRQRSEAGEPDSLGAKLFGVTRSTTIGAALVQKLPLGGDASLGYSFDKIGTDIRGAYGVNLSIVQPLLRKFGSQQAFSPVIRARISEHSQAAALRAEVLSLTFAVKAAYYDVLRRRQLMEVNRRAIERDQQLVDFSRAKVEAKLATRRDVLSAEIVLDQNRGRLLNAENQYRSAVDDLMSLMGVRVPTNLDLVDEDIDMTPIPLDEDKWVTQALRQNPDIERARWGLAADELSLQLAANDRLPQLDLEVSYDRSFDALTADFSTARPETRNWEGTVKFSIPILNSGPRASHRIAQLRYEQSRRALLEAERQLILQVRDAVRDLQRSSDRIKVVARTIEGAQSKVEFASVNFQLGRASNLDITDAQKDLIEAETDYVDELVSYRISLARLEQLLGGSIQ